MSNTLESKTMTHADALAEDPRVRQAKQLLAEAIEEHSRSLTEVRPASPDLTDAYQATIDGFTAARGGPPIWPYFSSGVGQGPYVELADGSVKLDFIAGIGVHGAGHGDPDVIDAAIDSALEDVVMQGNLQQNALSVKLLQKLIDLASQHGAPIAHGLLSTSGAMANENALKLAFHHAAPADRIIAFDNAFAGRSIALAALTDKAAYRSGLPLALNVDYLPFRDPDDPVRSQRWAVDELKRLLDRHPNKYAAFWAEPIAGEGGYYAGSHEFFAALCEPLRDAGVPIIFDEVQSFSRTSRPFAFQHYGLDAFADIVTVGKITQACATLYRKEFHPSAPILSQTFTASSSAIRTGLKILEKLESANCFGDNGANMQRHQYFTSKLSELAAQYPDRMSGPFGEGMMIGFTPGSGSFEDAKSLMTILYDLGLLGFVCGANPTRLRFLPPPAITTQEHIDQAMKILTAGVEAFRPGS